MRIFTVGHSNLEFEEFVQMLEAAGVAEQLSLTGPIVLGGGLGSSSVLRDSLAEAAAAAGLSAPEPLRALQQSPMR